MCFTSLFVCCRAGRSGGSVQRIQRYDLRFVRNGALFLSCETARCCCHTPTTSARVDICLTTRRRVQYSSSCRGATGLLIADRVFAWFHGMVRFRTYRIIVVHLCRVRCRALPQRYHQAKSLCSLVLGELCGLGLQFRYICSARLSRRPIPSERFWAPDTEERACGFWPVSPLFRGTNQPAGMIYYLPSNLVPFYDGRPLCLQCTADRFRDPLSPVDLLGQLF